MKKLLSVALCLALALALIPVMGGAAQATGGEGWYFTWVELVQETPNGGVAYTAEMDGNSVFYSCKNTTPGGGAYYDLTVSWDPAPPAFIALGQVVSMTLINQVGDHRGWDGYGSWVAFYLDTEGKGNYNGFTSFKDKSGEGIFKNTTGTVSDYLSYQGRAMYIQIKISSEVSVRYHYEWQAGAPAVQSVTATPTASQVSINGNVVDFDAYNIAGNNYFKLRDVAYAINWGEKSFEVSWDGAKNAISLTSGKNYTAVGGEMTRGDGKSKTATLTNSTIYLDGKQVSLTAYNIGGNNYFKLRDIGQAFDFNVSWDGAGNRIIINTSESYTAD